MPYTFVQSAFASNQAGVVPSLQSTSITVTAGNTLIVWSLTSHQVTGAPTGNGNTFSNVFVSAQVASAAFLNCWICQNANAGATQITQGDTTNGAVYGVFVEEVSGLVTSGGVLGSISNVQAPGVLGANVLTSGNINVIAVPAGVFGFSLVNSAFVSGTSGNDPQVGTSLAFTGRTVGWTTTSGPSAAAEDIRVTAAGGVAATFGIATDQYSTYVTGAIVIAEAHQPANAASIAWVT